MNDPLTPAERLLAAWLWLAGRVRVLDRLDDLAYAALPAYRRFRAWADTRWLVREVARG